MALVDITSHSQLTESLAAAASTGSLSVVHFWASWANACQQVNDALVDLAKLHPLVRFFKVEAENVPEAAEQYEIAAVPTLLLIQNSKVVDTINGANIPELSKKITAQSALAVPKSAAVVAPAQPATSGNLEARIDSLIKQSQMVIFIKGTPTEPRCGFSRQLLTLLDGVKADYSYFNILSDEDVRQGLKVKLDWPTFPMVIVDGELVGGLDIVKEMIASGELQGMIPVKSA
ncbi:glutaredoxin-3 [Capsaspora owczarzaki ATCC 30864]|uniref:Glutaredoxin-3 n=1 Tax=Capsaspora owczarzaki (strain ATCC 30864) TaxID=595528 RepID=A0A0D2UAZ0_CAPO3|nr:glutaredoxin-3 [Capsaspora owczarzaki ATCC 30864]KJE92206.1 glutaredoxin-3 [Capsaspora owczarzaki ATCC 30864]|eukprot:XP_004364057.2 glutaredoxin-3 [Capsaspora owczarzaki ATCC 30864]